MRVEHRTHYTSERGATRAVEVTSASTAVLPVNEERRGLTLMNDSAQAVYLGIGVAAQQHKDIVVLPDGEWDGRIGGVVWTGAVNAIVAAGTANLLVVEV